jgi:hypothetical protein
LTAPCRGGLHAIISGQAASVSPTPLSRLGRLRTPLQKIQAAASTCSFPPQEPCMKMPKYEKIRNKRMGLFRRRDSETAPEGPSRLWSFLNSSFGLWIFTATFGSFVAATYSSLQVCIKDADDRMAKYSRLQSEILSRQSAILEAIIRAQSIDDLGSRLKNIAAGRQEFKDTPLRSLNLDYRDIQNLIRPNESVTVIVRQVSDAYGFDYEDRKYLSLVDGTLPDDISEAELSNIKALALKFANLLSTAKTLSSRYGLVQSCTVPRAFLSLWQSRGPILEYQYLDQNRTVYILPPTGSR